ncbi:MAG: phage tail sheath C-terminal domain-containing protein [Leptolyngbyaceae cyanobacterium MO_188.B28]|nr:phage tail sheath C-terminal domain-containing protein [Leptolyngbyaceae cyanobacterium MO_188.B28]
MATVYKTPGVYIEEISKFPPSIAQVETAIPAFIGYTAMAKVGAEDFHDATPPIVRPVRITSLVEYERYFGKGLNEKNISVKVIQTETTTETDATNSSPSPYNMYYALQAYFANGGGPCYIVSVGKMEEGTSPRVEPLQDGLTSIEKEDEITLIVFPESLSLIDGSNVNQAPSYADFKGLYDQALDQCARLKDRFVVMDAWLDPSNPNTTLDDAVRGFRDHGIGTGNLKYGAAYGPRLKTIFNYLYKESEVPVEIQITQSDGSTETIQTTMEEINPEKTPTTQQGDKYPLVERAVADIPAVLPAAPLIVGVYADVDRTRGVWKAPANVSLRSVVEPILRINNKEQENLNVHTTGKSINAIRAFTGKGVLIWGARTLAGNSNEWRYVPVRRFFNMAEESIMKGTEPFVFEPNDANTWTKVRAMIENFLLLQWRAGALQGAKPEHAFYVRVGLNETMTALDILEGRMIVEIGMAVVRPAEFIILRFSHKMAES